MPRRKVKIKRIENGATRQITFSKRRAGLFKKAHDLSVLCDAKVAVIVFSEKGRLFEFASPSMESILKRYMDSQKYLGISEEENSSARLLNGDKHWVTTLRNRLKMLRSDLVELDLERLSGGNLIRLEQEMNYNLGRIRAKKDQLILREIESYSNKELMHKAHKRKEQVMNEKAARKVDCQGPCVSNSTALENADEEFLQMDRYASYDGDVIDECPSSVKKSMVLQDLNRLPSEYAQTLVE
ncbi:hypothetical protein KP509_12G051800 [Ceratopteris richardii]|uniref:MADS-box protein n=1 Tax=Ceratopteris richardii TaxID=49495 RepID=O82095_CERRI|nr:MADS-box protein [Ceratopteris richardii]KAH7423370.1 hypothetical protein KP509_12G051800 [Ceratopteris richardii]KAH7423371.1 hypothetical protein KP509_12G051800 [Ceratopteris richardii]